jgi:hypothetical protein
MHRASLISSMCTCSYTVFPREKIGLSLATEAKRLTLGARGFDQEVRGVGFRSWFICFAARSSFKIRLAWISASRLLVGIESASLPRSCLYSR